MAIQIKATRALKSLAGLLVGAVVSTAIALPFTGMVHESPDPELNEGYASMLIAGSLMVTMFAVPVGLVGHAILSALKRREAVVYAMSGGVGGFLFSFVMGGGIDRLQTIPLYTLWAAGCALIAWLIRRPDKDAVVPLDTHF
ncbi:hypothetical protein ABAC460_08280 [Asticcacaulis sp. AC460]|uniref:hypothetical protein n=1 Tax=Asticcacaulis sp. AC460 TaxID=1282360 RepID=UPI0003C3C831|nr:hypothetical protein [Asticcacaulis sp. AC460]ESQ90816.1 hypothetical protein ABAC460_08280 [Asticcacaulis sp. AC460]